MVTGRGLRVVKTNLRGVVRALVVVVVRALVVVGSLVVVVGFVVAVIVTLLPVLGGEQSPWYCSEQSQPPGH